MVIGSSVVGMKVGKPIFHLGFFEPAWFIRVFFSFC